VERAALVDQLRLARERWSRVGTRLLPRVQGLSKAPRLQHELVHTLGRDCATHAAVAHAVLGALPRLATEAGDTIARLGGNLELVTARRGPGEVAARWHPLDPALVRSLVDDVAEAGVASRHLSDALRQHTSARPPAPAVPVQLPAQRQGLGVAR